MLINPAMSSYVQEGDELEYSQSGKGFEKTPYLLWKREDGICTSKWNLVELEPLRMAEGCTEMSQL